MKKTLTYCMLVLASLFWGASFIVTKEIFANEPNITVFELVSLRLILASAFTIPILLASKKMERIRKGDLKWFLLLSFCEPFIYYIMETNALRLVSGSLASVVIATIPLFVTLAAAAVYRDKLRAVDVCGVTLSLIGIVIMLAGGGELRHAAAASQDLAKGMLFLAGGVFIAVVYTILLVRIARHYRATTITAYQNLISLVYYLPVMFAVDGVSAFTLHLAPKTLLLILCLGILCSSLAYIFYSYGIQHLGATSACVFNNVIPVFSLLTALLIGQESLNVWKVTGMLVALAGATIAQIKPSQQH